MIALLLLLAGARSGTDLEGALESLRSPHAAERAAGQRWIEVHAGPADAPFLEAAAAAGDAELCARLAAALGADDRHLGLTLGLARSGVQPVATLGRDALDLLMSRWLPGIERAPLAGAPALEALSSARLRARYQRLRVDLTAAGALVLERVARAEPSAPPLVVDPVVDPGVGERARGLDPDAGSAEGAWDAITAQLLRAGSLGLEVVLADVDERDGGAGRAALALFVRPGEEGLRLPSERVASWCLEIAGGEPRSELDEAHRTAAALALAATEWPAALDWLESLWVSNGDLAAREGLLLAAARGRVAGALRAPERAGALLAELGGGVPGAAGTGAPDAADGWSASNERGLAALIQVGPLLAGGADHCERACRGVASSERGSWVLFALVEGWRSCCEQGAQKLRDTLAAPPGAASIELRLQALRASVASGIASRERPATIGDPQALLSAAIDGPSGREVAALLVRSGAEPPGAWRALAGAPESMPWRAQCALAEWWLGRGEAPECARALVAAGVLDLAPGTAAQTAAHGMIAQALAARVLDTWVALGRSGEVDEVLTALAAIARAEPSAPGAEPSAPGAGREWAAARLALLAGQASDEQARALAGALLADPSGADPAALAALAGRSADREGAAARERLLALVAAQLGRPDEGRAVQLAAALNAAVSGLFARGEDAAAQRFWDGTMRQLAAQPTHPLTLRIMRTGFPASLRQEVVDLDARQRVPPTSVSGAGTDAGAR